MDKYAVTVCSFSQSKKSFIQQSKCPSADEWINKMIHPCNRKFISQNRNKVLIPTTRDFPIGSSGKEPACQGRRHKRHKFDPWIGKIPWRRKWHPIPVFLPGKSHGQRSLVSYSPWGHKEPNMTEHPCTPHTHGLWHCPSLGLE